MKVLHVLNLSIPNATGYAVRSKYIVEFQKKLGIQPFVVTSSRQLGVNKEVENINSIKYYRTNFAYSYLNGILGRIPFLREKLVMSKLQYYINKIVDEQKIDIIHAHSPILCGIPSLSVAKNRNLKFIYEIRALWEDAAVDQSKTKELSLRYQLTRKLETKLANKADKIIVICEGLKKELVARGIHENKIQVVPNGVDTNKFLPIEKDENILRELKLQNKMVIGFIGSFYKFEGIKILLLAAQKILKRKNDIKFLIVGGGKEELNLKNMTKELNIQNDVIFTGRVPHQLIKKYYSIMDILVYPRLQMRITDLVTPLKPLEAMSMGKIVLASDVGGLKELIEDKNIGFIFRAGDPNDLADKCLAIFSNKYNNGQIKKKAREAMVLNREWGKIIPIYLNIYHNFEKDKNENN